VNLLFGRPIGKSFSLVQPIRIIFSWFCLFFNWNKFFCVHMFLESLLANTRHIFFFFKYMYFELCSIKTQKKSFLQRMVFLHFNFYFVIILNNTKKLYLKEYKFVKIYFYQSFLRQAIIRIHKRCMHFFLKKLNKYLIYCYFVGQTIIFIQQ
jgi:hypothetical protein